MRLPIICSKPETIVISGGGMRGIHGLGAVAKLREDGHLSNVKRIVGTSSGSIVGYALATDQLEKAFGVALRQKPQRDVRIDRIATGFGVDSGKTLDDFIEKLFEPRGAELTFSKLLEESGKDLHVVATNVTKRRVEYFCAADTPEASVMEAVRHSCTVPGLFAIKRKSPFEDVYVDGGLLQNFPLERAREISKGGNVLGIRYDNDETVSDEVRDVRDFLVAIFETVTNSGVSRPLPNERVLTIQSERITLDFGADVNKKVEWFVSGARSAAAFLKKNV